MRAFDGCMCLCEGVCISVCDMIDLYDSVFVCLRAYVCVYAVVFV